MGTHMAGQGYYHHMPHGMMGMPPYAHHHAHPQAQYGMMMNPAAASMMHLMPGQGAAAGSMSAHQHGKDGVSQSSEDAKNSFAQH